MNENSKKPFLTGMFSDLESAEKAYSALLERGYTTNDVHVIMSSDTRKKHFEGHPHPHHGNKALQGLGTGSAIGGTLGAIAGIVAAIGTSIVLPGLGMVVAGPIAAGLAGVGAGSITGGLIGALIGWGIPKESAARYEEGIRRGKIVLGVHPKNEDDARYIENQWHAHRGEEVHTH